MRLQVEAERRKLLAWAGRHSQLGCSINEENFAFALLVKGLVV